ncbi:MAG: polyprenyl synthetase family protein, partial [Clostridia bacterium]|nr:polyprenyl synthetase family protein [Clostridia bacterium]
ADASALERIRTFAQRLGLAFQVRDDLLDAENEDCPLVAKLGTAGAEALAEKLSSEASQALAGFDNNGFLLTLTEKLLHRNR